MRQKLLLSALLFLNALSAGGHTSSFYFFTETTTGEFKIPIQVRERETLYKERFPDRTVLDEKYAVAAQHLFSYPFATPRARNLLAIQDDWDNFLSSSLHIHNPLSVIPSFGWVAIRLYPATYEAMLLRVNVTHCEMCGRHAQTFYRLTNNEAPLINSIFWADTECASAMILTSSQVFHRSMMGNLFE